VNFTSTIGFIYYSALRPYIMGASFNSFAPFRSFRCRDFIPQRLNNNLYNSEREEYMVRWFPAVGTPPPVVALIIH
jgi:hypothetical protein